MLILTNNPCTREYVATMPPDIVDVVQHAILCIRYRRVRHKVWCLQVFVSSPIGLHARNSKGIPPLVYAYPNRHEVHTRTPLKGWDQDIGHSHGYTAYAIYTVAPHVEPYRFDTRGAFDNFSDVSSNSSPSDQSLNAAFQVMTIEEPVSSGYLPSAFSQSSPSLQYPNSAGTRCGNVAYPGYDRGYTLTGLKPRAATRRKAEQAKEKQTLYRSEFFR